MALKLLQLLSFVFLIFLAFTTISHAKRGIPSEKVTSPFDFIKKLEGCHKGNHTKGIHHLKNYLKLFGYLKYLNQTHANNDDYDDVLESAVKAYQQNFHIKPTGTLDATTVSKMITPRCGVSDIINGTNTMLPKKHGPSSGSKSIHIVSHYSFFEGSPRWPSSKTHLTYRFIPNTRRNAIAPVARAFRKWASATHFTFSRVSNNGNADLVIGFYRRDHGDGSPFDGRGGTLAHAFAPTNGRFHYDADERWSTGRTVADSVDLENVALHEIGHLLGLHHSSVQAATMYPIVQTSTRMNLHQDDIAGIRALYGV